MSLDLTEQQQKLVNNLMPIVRKLTPKAKQAMYAAARHSLINRRSWDNCAFNAAGKVVESSNIDSFTKGATAFGMHEGVVRHFIEVWDNSTIYLADSKKATDALIYCIEKAGLFTTGKLKVKVIRDLVHKNRLEKEKEDFEAIVKGVDITSDDDSFAQEVAEMASLLNHA